MLTHRATAVVATLAGIALACSDSTTSGYRRGDTATAAGDIALGDPVDADGGDVAGDAQLGDPDSGDPAAGDPAAGDPAAGDPTAGDPATGDSMLGDPRSGDSSPGDSLVGDPTPGDPGLTGCDLVGLCVRLSWDAASGDLDLHLSRDDAPYCSNQSCYFGNCKETSSYRIEWDGESGLSRGDPELFDDSWGWGPETIEVAAPVDGTYVVGVYYQPSGNTAVQATVDILAHGVVVATTTGTLVADGFWEALAVTYIDGVPGDPSEIARSCAAGVWSCNDSVGSCP